MGLLQSTKNWQHTCILISCPSGPPQKVCGSEGLKPHPASLPCPTADHYINPCWCPSPIACPAFLQTTCMHMLYTSCSTHSPKLLFYMSICKPAYCLRAHTSLVCVCCLQTLGSIIVSPAKNLLHIRN